MYYYKFLELPDPPQEFIDIALTNDPGQYGPKSSSNVYSGVNSIVQRQVTQHQVTKNGQPVKNIRNIRFDAPLPFASWVKENVVSNFFECSIALADGVTGATLPHTDRARNWSLLYIINAGGSTCRTCFWKEKNHSILRPRLIFPNTYDDLELLVSADLGEKRWVLLNTRILHSVEGMQTPRLTFQISIESDVSELKKFFVDK